MNRFKELKALVHGAEKEREILQMVDEIDEYISGIEMENDALRILAQSLMREKAEALETVRLLNLAIDSLCKQRRWSLENTNEGGEPDERPGTH